MQKKPQRKTEELEQQMDSLRNDYDKWKTENFKNKKGFFPVFNDFKDTNLSGISGGALKAYIYFGIHANNKTGECWHSVERMSDFFMVDQRTVKKWINELEERNLIVRIQKGFKRVANTFLVGYENETDQTSHKTSSESVPKRN